MKSDALHHENDRWRTRSQATLHPCKKECAAAKESALLVASNLKKKKLFFRLTAVARDRNPRGRRRPKRSTITGSLPFIKCEKRKKSTRAQCPECRHSRDIRMSSPQAYPSHDTGHFSKSVAVRSVSFGVAFQTLVDDGALFSWSW